MANTVNMISTGTGGKVITQTITDVNPNATDSDISQFIVSLASLSDNTLTGIQKTVKNKIYTGDTVDGTDEGETITCAQYGDTIDAKGGNDYISIAGAISNVISLGTGNNYVYIRANSTKNTIYGGSGVDTYYAQPSNIQPQGGVNYIVGFDSDNDILYFNSSYYSVTDSVQGNDTFINISYNESLNTAVVLKDISSGTLKAQVSTGNFSNALYEIGTGFKGLDISNSENGVNIYGSYFDDIISNSGDNVSIYPYTGNDSISNSGSNVYISSGDGNDSISLENSSSNCTIHAQTGDNIIYGNGGSHLYTHYRGGNETIFGWSDNDSLEFVNVMPTGSIQTADGYSISAYDSTTAILNGNFSNPPILIIPEPETLTTTASYETLIIASGSEVSVRREGSEVWTVATPKVLGNTSVPNIINAGSGNDTLNVLPTAQNVSIYGGRLHDLISITGHGESGNYYVYDYGDGHDTIYGWDCAKDTLCISDSTYEVSMSSDGNDFIAKVGSGSVRFIGLTAGVDSVKIQAQNDSVPVAVPVPKIMMGGTKGDKIYNYGDSVKNGTANSPWTIDAGGGADSIISSGDYISINAGAANDKISIKAGANGVTKGVSIVGGAGNDIINVSEDVSISGSVTIYGGHVYEYTYNADGRDSIFGYNSNDSIVIKDIPDSPFLVSDVDTLGNYLIKFGSSNVLIQKPADKRLAGIHLNVFNGALNADSIIPMGTAITENGKTHYEIPKKLLSTTVQDNLIIDSSYDGYTVDAAAGNDTITVYAKAASIFGGSGSDIISLVGGTNVDSLGNVSTADAVTICGGYGYDSIFAADDYKVVNGETVYASHVYQHVLYDGNDYIYGYNSNDTLQISNATVSGSLVGNEYIVYVNGVVGLITLYDYNTSGNRLNVIDANNAPLGVSGADNFDSLGNAVDYNSSLVAYSQIP